MENAMIYLQNLMTIEDITSNKEQDPLPIYLVLESIKQEIQKTDKNLLNDEWICLKNYLDLKIRSLYSSYYAQPMFMEYCAFLLEMCKSFYWQKRSISFLQKELKKIEEKGEFSKLDVLYTILYFLMRTKSNCLLTLAERSLTLKGDIEGYTYESNLEIEDPKKYEQEIKEGILTLKRKKERGE